jgi:GTP-binding protein Era
MKTGTFIIVGKPNTGKSTLFNLLLKNKLQSTSDKAHTTKSMTAKSVQDGHFLMEYIDTPGYEHLDDLQLFCDVDGVLLMTTMTLWSDVDVQFLQALAAFKKPIILLINKIDQLAGWKDPHVSAFSQKVSGLYPFHDVYVLSAKHGHHLETIERKLQKLTHKTSARLPFNYNASTQQARVLEIVKEKIFRHLHHEIPHIVKLSVNQINEVMHVTIGVQKNQSEENYSRYRRENAPTYYRASAARHQNSFE